MMNSETFRAADFLRGIAYPLSRADLINHATQQGAKADVVASLERLPAQTFEGPFGLSEAFGALENGREQRRLAEPLATEETRGTLRAVDFLGGIAYPLSRADLINHATQQGA